MARYTARVGRALTILLAAAVVTVISPSPAGAEPDPAPVPPASAQDAQRQWLTAARDGAVLNEQVLQAQATLDEATARSVAAAESVDEARAEASAAATAAEQAAAALAQHQNRVDRFVNASFRGARLDPLAPLLTAGSPDELLDQMSALDRVAADAGNTLQAADSAAQVAANTAEHREHAQAEAIQWQQEADRSRAAAEQASADLAARQADLDRQAGVYQALYGRLSAEERDQAIAEQEERDAQAAGAAAAEPAPAGPTDLAATRDRAEIPTTAGSVAGQSAVQAALSKVGSAYVWGAAGPDAFDCSGLTSWAWRQAGVTIPRTSREQEGLQQVPLDQLQPGDLVTYYSPVSHVAMYIGNGQIVQASTPSKPVFVTDLYRGGPNPTGHRVG